MKYKTTLYIIFVLTLFFSSSNGSKGGPIAVSGSFSSSSSSSHSSASSSSSSGSFAFSGNVGANEIGGLKSYASAIDALSGANAGALSGANAGAAAHAGAAAGAKAGAGVGAGVGAGLAAYSSVGAGSNSGANAGAGVNIESSSAKESDYVKSGNVNGALSGCCKGPFPGPQGSIHDSKPASSVPPPQNNNQPASTHRAPILPVNTVPTSAISADAGAGISGHSFKPDTILAIIPSFPGPSGSIHSSKPATGGEPTYKNPTIIATVPISNGGNNYNYNYKPTHTPISTSVINSLPGSQGSIHTSKPASTGFPSQGFGNQPIQPQQPISPGQPTVINTFPAAPGDIHSNKPASPGFSHPPVYQPQTPISGGNPSTISSFPGAPGNIHTNKPASNPSYINQSVQQPAVGNISPTLISSLPGGTDDIHANKPATLSPSFVNQPVSHPTTGSIPSTIISSFPAGPGNIHSQKPSEIFSNQQPGSISVVPPVTGGSYNTGSSVSSSGSSAVGAGLTGTFIASLPGPPGSIHQSKPIGNNGGNNYRPIVGPICYNKPGQNCQNTQNQLPTLQSTTSSPYGTFNQNLPSPPNNNHPIVGPICFNKPGQSCQNIQNQLPTLESVTNPPSAPTNENQPLLPNNNHPILGPICFNKQGQGCQPTQNQLPPLARPTNVPFTTTTNYPASPVSNQPSNEPNCSYQPGATNPCKILPTNLLPPTYDNVNFAPSTTSNDLNTQTESNTGVIPQDQSNSSQEPQANIPVVLETTTHSSPQSFIENSQPGVQSSNPGCSLSSGSCNNPQPNNQKTDNLPPPTNNQDGPKIVNQPPTIQSSYQPLKPGQVITTGNIISGGPAFTPFVPDGSFPTLSQEILPPYTTILNHPGQNKPCCQGPYPGPDGSIYDYKPATDSNPNLSKNNGNLASSLDDTDKKLNQSIIFMDQSKDNLGGNTGSGSYVGSTASAGADNTNSGFATGNVLIQKADGSVSGGTDKLDVKGQYTGDTKPNTNSDNGFATGNILIQKGDSSVIIDTDKALQGNNNDDGFVVVIQKEGPEAGNGGPGQYGTTSISSYGPLSGGGGSSFGNGGSYASVGTYGTGNAGQGGSYGCSTGKCNSGGVVSGTGSGPGLGNSAYGNSFAGGYGFGGSGGNFGSPEHGIRELGNLFNNLFGKNGFSASSGGGSFSKSGSYAGASSFASANAGSFAGHY